MNAVSKHTSKVAVIGAGIAGLTAAYRLHRQGADVHVYEGRSRVGGRIFSAKIGDEAVEFGGQNIADGGGAENLHHLIEELDLELTNSQVLLDMAYFSDGKLVPLQGLINEK